MILLENAVANFSWLELIWSATALIGLFVGVQNFIEAHKDIAALEGIRNGRWRIARGNVRRERVRATIFIFWGVLGVMAGFTPPNPGATAVTLVSSLGLVGTSMLLTLNSYYDRRDRLYLLHAPIAVETQYQREDREMGDHRRELPSVKGKE